MMNGEVFAPKNVLVNAPYALTESHRFHALGAGRRNLGSSIARDVVIFASIAPRGADDPILRRVRLRSVWRA
jgi:hypothetical protein